MGATPMHLAARAGHAEVVAMLAGAIHPIES
jgi:ankyrin repeat protein